MKKNNIKQIQIEAYFFLLVGIIAMIINYFIQPQNPMLPVLGLFGIGGFISIRFVYRKQYLEKLKLSKSK